MFSLTPTCESLTLPWKSYDILCNSIAFLGSFRMGKRNINAHVKSIERSLNLIYKNLFSIKQYQFPPKLAWICLKNHSALRHCLFVDGCGYTFSLDGQKSWWGATGSGGRTAKCAAKEDETWLWPWQYHLSMFSPASAGVMNTVSVFFLARARK